MAVDGRYISGKDVDSYERVLKKSAASGGVRTEIESGTEAPKVLMPGSLLKALENVGAKTAKTALDMQKKKEDRLEAKNPVDSLQIKKDRTQKEYDEYVSSDDYRKKQAESVRDQQRAMDQDESRSFAPTSDFGAFPAAQDAMEARLRQEKERAESEFNAREDRETFEKGMAEIDAMSEEDLVLLDEYVRNRDMRQDVFVNDISWFISNKKEGDALKALAEKYGEEKALQLAEIYGMNLHEQNAKAAEEQGKAGVNDGWISATAHNLLGIPARAFGNITGFVGRLNAETNRTGQFHGLPTYTAGDELSAYGDAVTGQTAQNIEGDVYDEEGNLIEDGGALRKVASWAYQGAMSIADSTARLAMSGGNSAIASAIAGMGTFNQSVQKYSAMGASPEQAYTAATMSAGIEYVTEKLPMDEGLKLLRSGGDPGVVKKVLTQAFLVEPSTEEVNLFANMAMEAMVLGEKSGKEQRIGDLIAGGLTRDQAEQQFWKETWMQAAETYAVSAFAGLIGGGGAAYAGNQVQMQQEQQQTLDPAADIAAPVADGAEQVQQEAQVPVLTDKDLVQLGMDSTAAGLQETAPAAAPVEPMTEHQQNLQMAFEDVMGGQEQAQSNIAPVRLFRGFNQSSNPTERNLTQRKSVYDLIGGKDPGKIDNLLPLAYYTENEEDARGYSDMDMRYLEAYKENAVREYRDKVMNGKNTGGLTEAEYAEKAAMDTFRTLHGREPNNAGHIESYDYTPGKTLDLTNLGDTTKSTAVYKELSEKLGITPDELDAALTLDDRFDSDEDFLTYLLLRNIPGYDTGTKLVNLAKNAGYDSIRYSEDGNSHYAIMTDQDGWDSRLQKANDYYDEFEDFGAGSANREEFLGRDWDEVGKRNVKAYMYENPEVKPYFQMEAQLMLMELADSTRGERTYNEDVHYESGGEQGWSGVKRDTSEDIAYLLDTAGFSYAEIEKGLNAIIEDNGAENNAASKRIEFILHNRLMNGHKDFYGDRDTYPDGRVPASDEYVQLINDKQITAYDNEPDAVDDNLTATANSPQTEDSGTMPADGGQIPTKGERDGQQVLGGFASSDFRNSNTYMNTGLQSENANIRKGYRQELRKNPDAAKYAVKHNADTLAEAQSRTGSPENNAAALQDLLNRDHWTPEDVATSTLLLDEIMASGDKAAIAQLNALRQKRKEAGVYFGQGSQSFAIHNPTMQAADSPAIAVDTFRKSMEDMEQEETTWNRKKGIPFKTWIEEICQDVDRIGIQIATVEEGDSDSMRKIILQIANSRGTTAWFGRSQRLGGNAWSVLKKLDFQDLKKVANTQLVAMADDYRARSAGEVAKGLRKQSMLSSLKTFVRNIGGNGVVGFADSVSESGAGRMADAVLSKFTGKQTMGSDILRAGTYAKAAREAGQFASLCVELNIPIETDVDSSYSAAAGNSGNNKYLGKTFRATGNPAMRALYAYQKYMSYALEVTDKIFEGGTNAAVAESLNRLQGANLTDEEVSALADFTGNRRTFKDATWKEDGKTKGAELSRLTASLKNAGGDTKAGKVYRALADYKVPFDKVPMNVTQTGIDYTTGVVKSIGEMIGIIKDANAGKTIPVERQRQAASDFGRGITGVGMIALFAAAAAKGVLRASDTEDRDKEALAQAEGRSGAQINWDALARGLEDGDAEWKDGDTITSLDFLEPFNTQMYLGYEIAQSEDINLLNYTGSTIKSVFNSMMDSPAFTGLSGLVEDVKDLFDAFDTDGFGGVVEEFGNVIAKNAGDYVSTYIPQWIRQTAQDMDGYYRDTRGQTAAETAINKVKSSVPWLSKKLPVKYSGLGEAQQRGGALETFLDPTATHEFQQNEVTTFLDALSDKVGEKANNIYPDRQAPMKFTYGDDREIKLDGKMRETYQKTYGEKVNELYTSLIHDKDFQGFSDELKIKALEEAKGYATRYAKAAVSDYREAPIGTVQDLAKGIVQREVKSQMDAFFTDLDTQRAYGYSTEQTVKNLDMAYDAFQDLSAATQKQILKDATSDTAKYLEVRAKGISTETFVDTTERIGKLKIQPEFKDIRPAQEFQVIAGMNISDSAKDILMKAWMEDYDPSVREKDRDTSELKYDYARNELGMSVAEYVDGYDIYTYEQKIGGEGTADRTRDRMQKELGITKAEAKALYKLYGGKLKETLIELYG